MAEAEHGLPSTWGLSQFHTMDNVIPYLRIQKCSDAGGCFSDTYKNMDGTPNTNLVDIDTSSSFPKFRLSNGVTLFTSHVNKDCIYPVPNNKSCLWIRVDLNADNPPNAQGVDLFGFYVTNEGVFPLDDSGHYGPVYCSKSRANYGNSSGINCAYIIMQQGNMDYLHP
ncbi:MAG: hypothetical protein PHX18_09135 [Candidatus Gastranaerophilales bacterium]|nr:hypothetical protein [Candidatus Gastranaerophilales bacterium]